MTIYITIIIVSMVIGWILTLVDNGERSFPVGFIGGIIGVAIPAILLVCVISEQPSAMDVYQGKTTLEVTYKDSVAIDSTVVFKEDRHNDNESH